MENKLKVWIARDEDGKLYIYFIHPFKGKGEWRLPDFHNEDGVGAKRIDSDLFPSVKWEDKEPTESYITLAEPQSEKGQPQSKQEQSKQEQTKQEQTKQEQNINWEQRRYEIAKEMLPVLYQQSAEVLKCGQSITWEETAFCALVLADTLIAKLKEQSE